MKETLHPYINAWIKDGSIELGSEGYSQMTARAMDSGAVICESEEDSQTLKNALGALERGIRGWCEQEGLDLNL